MRARYALMGMFVMLTWSPTSASAVTVEQIVSLSNAGVSQTVILALIDRDKTIFTLEPDQLITLKNDGISDEIIVAMLKSGRAEGEAAADANAAVNAAIITSALSVGPDPVVVGHGPERPRDQGAQAGDVCESRGPGAIP